MAKMLNFNHSFTIAGLSVGSFPEAASTKRSNFQIRVVSLRALTLPADKDMLMAKKKTKPSPSTTRPSASAAPSRPSLASAAPATTPANLWERLDQPLLWGAVLAALTALVYWASLSNGFMVFDDDKAIRYNEVIKNPTFRNIFVSNNLGMYAPVTWLGYALVYAIAGENASAFHTFSLLLHIGCVLTVFALMRRLQPNREVAFFTALLFALHPVQVEATSWIAGQSALTFSFFYLLGLLAYVHYQQRRQGLFYGLTLLAFVLSVLAKSAAVTLPLLLLALDWYQQGKWRWANVWNKIPFFAISLVFGLYTFFTREAEGHQLVVASKTYNLFDRFLMVCHSLLFYPVQLLAPLRLSIYYPMEKIGGIWSWDYYAAPLVVAALTWLVWRFAQKQRIIGLSALWYVLPLVVMLPYVTVGTFEMRSDRYVYVSSVGFFLLLVWLAQRLSPGIRWALLGVLAAFYGYLAHQRSLVWKNEVSVFRDCIEKQPQSPLCQCNLAYGELLNHEYENSIKHYTEALRLDPTYVESYNGRGQAYLMLERYEEALADFDKAIEAGIVTPRIFLNRGKCYFILKKPELALPDLKRSLELEPRNPETYLYKGLAENQTGNPEQALQDFAKALELSPNLIDAHLNRALVLANLKRYEEAIADYTAVIHVNEGIPTAWNNRAAAYMMLGQYDKALADVNRALQINPNYAIAYRTRANIYRALGQLQQAEADMQRALQSGR